MRRALIGGRSPLGVPPRHLRQRPNATTQLEPRDFLGIVRSARPDGSKDGAHRNAFLRESRRTGLRLRHSRALPAPCCPSPARLHPQSGHDAVRACLAQAAREPGDEPRPAGTALAPPDGVTRPASWYGGEIRLCVPHSVTICQVLVLLSATSLPCVLRGPTLASGRTAPPPAEPLQGRVWRGAAISRGYLA